MSGRLLLAWLWLVWGAVVMLAAQPNIVVILADDLGHGDLSCYGSPDIRTPAIDGIAERGLRLTRYYHSAPSCTPTRTALLTGRYPQRVGGLENPIGLGNVGRYDEAVWLQERGELGLPGEESTLPQALRAAGYRTAVVGKWHLGYERKFWPGHHGFEESLVVLGGGVDYVTHQEPEPSPPLLHNGEASPRSGYLTDVQADHAIAWLDARRAEEAPYFLYLPFTAPHEPWQAPGDGPKPPDKWKEGTCDTYRRMVEHLDRRVGDVLAAIARDARAANTIVIFTSDNGATGRGSNAPFRGYKASVWEGGIRGPCAISWPAGLPAGRAVAQTTVTMDLTATLLAVAGVEGRRLDGENLLAIWRGESEPRRRTLFWRSRAGPAGGNRAVLEGDWKFLVQAGAKYLFDLGNDPLESTNLLKRESRQAAELAARLAAWEGEVEAPRLAGFRARAR